MWNRTRSKVVSVLASVAGLGVSWVAAPSLPDRMPIHWGPEGMPDGFAPKAVGLLLMPLLSLALSLGLPFIALRESEKTQALFGWTMAAMAGFFFGVHAMMIHAALTPTMAFLLSAMFGLIGILMIAIAGMMPLTEPNRVMGYRLKATMNDPTIWKLTHRFAAKSIVISSVAMIGAGFVLEGVTGVVVCMALLFIGTLAPVVYAKMLHSARS